jgi:serine protease Do
MRRFTIWLGLVCCGIALTTPATAQDAEKTTWLGVQLGRSSDATIEGVPVARVIQDSPAHKGGLRARDVIIAVDGQAVLNNAELIKGVQVHDVGSWVSMTVSRKGREHDLRVRLAERPESGKMKPLTGWIGVRAIALPPTLREHFGAPEDSGVMISLVEAGSPAEIAGFQLGDVIYEVEGRPVKGPGDLYKLMGGAGVGNRVELLATRWGQDLELEALVEAAPDGGSSP